MDIFYPALTNDATAVQFLDSLAKLRDQHATIQHWRNRRDQPGQNDILPTAWAELREAGWRAVLLPEAADGFDLPLSTVILAARELGRSLAGVPFLSNCILLPWLLRSAPEDVARGFLAGEGHWGLAIEREHTAFAASRSGTDLIVQGEAAFALDAMGADTLICAAMLDGQDAILMLPMTEDISVTRQVLVDERNCAKVSVPGTLRLPESAVLAEGRAATALLEQLRDVAALGLAAEMLGITETAFEMAVDYLKVRKQFGVTIGSFQALQHRCARAFCELELARGLLASLANPDADELPRAASLAKAGIGRAAVDILSEAFQFHGGIAMTDEFDIGLLLKRLHVAERQFGSRRYHEDRIGLLLGY